MSAAEQVVAPSLLERIHESCEVPARPGFLAELDVVAVDPDATAEDVAQVIEGDPPVATEILQIVNSPCYGLQVHVSSVALAVSILGLHLARKVALRAAVLGRLRQGAVEAARGFDVEAFRDHSVYTGILARVLGQASAGLTGVHPEEVHVAGILHDFGKLVLWRSRPDAFGEVVAACAGGLRPSVEVERELLGYTHAEVGSVLAVDWALPGELAVAIRYHSRPEDDPSGRILSRLIAAADRLAAQRGRPSVVGLPAPVLPAGSFDALRLDEGCLDGLLAKADAAFAAGV